LSWNKLTSNKMTHKDTTSRKGYYTRRLVFCSDFNRIETVGNISGWNGNGIPTYDINNVKGEKIGEMNNTFIKKNLRSTYFS